MASSRRTLVLFLVLSCAHLLLMSVQVQARSGLPLIQAAAFGMFAAVQQGTSAIADAGQSFWSNYLALRGVAAENDALKRRVLELEGHMQAQAAILALMLMATGASILATAALGLIAFVPFVGLAALPLQVFAWLVRGVVFQFVGLTGVATYVRLHRALQASGVPVRPADGFQQVTRA